MSFKQIFTLALSLASFLLTGTLATADSTAQDLLAKLWTGDAWFQEQPETIGNPGDHMHFLSMFWDSDPVDTPGDPHYKAYYIGAPGFSTRLARSYDGVGFVDTGPVLTIGSPGQWDDRIASFSSVWKDNGTYYLVYEGAGTDSMWPGDIGLATSADGVNFTRQGRIFTHATRRSFERTNIGTPSLHKEGDTWYLYYHGYDGEDVQVNVATGTDLATNMTRVQTTPLIPTSSDGWDSGTVGKRSRLVKAGDYYYMAYEGSTDKPFDTASWSTGMARSTDLLHWERLPTNPVLPVTGSGFGLDGPEMLLIDDDIYIYYRTLSNHTARAKLVASVDYKLDFEGGDFSGWGYVSMDGVVGDNGPSSPGSHAAAMTIANPQSYEQAVSKGIRIRTEETLDLSFDYKTLPGATGGWRVQLRYWNGVGANGFSDGSTATFLGEHSIALDTTNGLWATKQVTELATPDPSATYVDIRIIANAFGSFEGTALVDNFHLSSTATVPEPSMLSLLLLGTALACTDRCALLRSTVAFQRSAQHD
ncbi:MAG: hypothetical protein KDA57_14820 [Planctomycetales bacterium]|nr:hypothetical protein [Planctomycetales bacterium]